MLHVCDVLLLNFCPKVIWLMKRHIVVCSVRVLGWLQDCKSLKCFYISERFFFWVAFFLFIRLTVTVTVFGFWTCNGNALRYFLKHVSKNFPNNQTVQICVLSQLYHWLHCSETYNLTNRTVSNQWVMQNFFPPFSPRHIFPQPCLSFGVVFKAQVDQKVSVVQTARPVCTHSSGTAYRKQHFPI